MRDGQVCLSTACVPPIVSIIAAELMDCQVTRAIRSVAAVLMIKFGDISSVDAVLPNKKKLKHEHGEWDLLVEFADWSLINGSNSICNAESSHAIIDANLEKMIGQSVTHVLMTATGYCDITFTDGALLRVNPSRLHGAMSQWCLFRQSRWSLCLENTGEFVLTFPARLSG
jgi:hypothetical protein